MHVIDPVIDAPVAVVRNIPLLCAVPRSQQRDWLKAKAPRNIALANSRFPRFGPQLFKSWLNDIADSNMLSVYFTFAVSHEDNARLNVVASRNMRLMSVAPDVSQEFISVLKAVAPENIS